MDVVGCIVGEVTSEMVDVVSLWLFSWCGIHLDVEATSCTDFGPWSPRHWEEHNSHHVHYSFGWRYLGHPGHVHGFKLGCRNLVHHLPVHQYHVHHHDPVGKGSHCWFQLFRVQPFGWLGHVSCQQLL